MRVIMFGVSKIAKSYLDEIKNKIIILAFADNNYQKFSKGVLGHIVISPNDITNYDFDKVIIALDDLKPGNKENIISVYNQLIKIGVPDNKIILQSFKYKIKDPRSVFIKNINEYFIENNINGAVAECGVHRGWFASVIAWHFKDSKFYLFDTFNGFDSRDVEKEEEVAKKWLYEKGAAEKFTNKEIEMVELRCENRERLIIKKGYVPETFKGINDKFCFVNLDMDLFAPQLAALEFFSDKMVKGGVILLHDYYNKNIPGTKKAVKEFSKNRNVSQLPIGDGQSIALILN